MSDTKKLTFADNFSMASHWMGLSHRLSDEERRDAAEQISIRLDHRDALLAACETALHWAETGCDDADSTMKTDLAEVRTVIASAKEYS